MDQYLDLIKKLIENNSYLIYIVVFIVGFLSSLTPHMFSMVMMFIGYFIDKDDKNRKSIFIRTFIFSVSFVMILVSLGLIVYFIGSPIHSIMKLSYISSSIILLIIGFRIIGFNLLRFKSPIKIFYFYVSNKQSIFSPMYIIFGLLFTPCSIPFVISILTIASLKGSLLYSIILLIIFGFGHSIIFIIGGISSSVINNLMRNNRIGKLMLKIYGISLVLIAIYLFYISFNH